MTNNFMNRITKLFIHAFIVVASLAAFSAVCPNAQAQTAKTDEQIRLKAEKQEVQKFVDSFLQSFEESKDFDEIPESYFVTDFKTRFSQNEKWRGENISEELFAQFSESERYEHNVSVFDFLYLGMMCSLYEEKINEVGNSEDDHAEDINIEKLFPPNVVKSIKKSKVLQSMYIDDDENNALITNVVELQNLVVDYKNVVEAQRKYLKENASEWKARFSKNISESRKQFKNYRNEICEEDDCEGLPEKTRIISVVAFPLVLEIILENGNLKILKINIYSE